MKIKNHYNFLRFASWMAGILGWLIILFIFWSAISIGETRIIVNFNNYGEMWFEFFLFNSILIFVIALTISQFKRMIKNE